MAAARGGHDGVQGRGEEESDPQGGHHGRAGGQVEAVGGHEPDETGGDAHAPADDEADRDAVRKEDGDDRGDDQEREHEEHARHGHRRGDHEGEGDVEDEVPQAHPATLGVGLVGCEGDLEEAPPEGDVQAPHQGVDHGGLDHRRPGDPEQAAHQGLLDVLGPLGGPVGHQDGPGQGHRVDDADDGLLGDALVPHPGHGEDGRPRHREAQGEQVGPRAVRAQAEEVAAGGAQGRDLGQGQVDEDDPALDDVHAQVGVDAHEHDAGGERRGHELEEIAHEPVSVALKASTRRVIQVSISSG